MTPEIGRLAPELAVSDLQASLAFWTELLGFALTYARADEGFAFLTQTGVHFMLEKQSEEGRRWLTGPLERPLGRGINFEITLPTIQPLLDRLSSANVALFMPPEEKSYSTISGLRTVRQFLVQDPDGYLLRFAEVLSETGPIETG